MSIKTGVFNTVLRKGVEVLKKTTAQKYQMFLKHGGTVFRFPVLPEEYKISYSAQNDTVRVYGVGEVTIIQDKGAATIQFSSFFPKRYFYGCNYKNIPKPKKCKKTILKMMGKKKHCKFTLTGKGPGISMYVTIEKFDIKEAGGDPGTLTYDMTLKEYRIVKARKIKVNKKTQKAKIKSGKKRVNTKTIPKTYTTKKNDSLSKLAKRFYGDSSKYKEIYKANKKKIGSNPKKLKAGLVLKIPEVK